MLHSLGPSRAVRTIISLHGFSQLALPPAPIPPPPMHPLPMLTLVPVATCFLFWREVPGHVHQVKVTALTTFDLAGLAAVVMGVWHKVGKREQAGLFFHAYPDQKIDSETDRSQNGPV